MKKSGCLIAAILLIAYCIWGGGYWENVPPLDRVSGPMRFRQHVVDPIPSYIQNIRGGYSGFPQGQVRTSFSFTASPNTWDFLNTWKLTSEDCRTQLHSWPWLSETQDFQVYQQRAESKSCSDNVYLIVFPKDNRGVLFIE